MDINGVRRMSFRETGKVREAKEQDGMYLKISRNMVWLRPKEDNQRHGDQIHIESVLVTDDLAS